MARCKTGFCAFLKADTAFPKAVAEVASWHAFLWYGVASGKTTVWAGNVFCGWQ